MTDRPHRSIGEVLHLLESEFPEVTISKIRFLESQGLLNPERTPSGYRMFFDTDVARLRWVLVQQRDNFLPLRVIKKRLDSGDWDPNEVEPLTSGDPAPESTTFSRVVEPVAETPVAADAAESVAEAPVAEAGAVTADVGATEPAAGAEPAAAAVAVTDAVEPMTPDAPIDDDTPQVVQLASVAPLAEVAPPTADTSMNGAAADADADPYLGFDEQDLEGLERGTAVPAAPQAEAPPAAPVPQQPVAQQPVAQQPVPQQPAAQQPAAQQPAVQEPVPQQPAAQQEPVATTPAPVAEPVVAPAEPLAAPADTEAALAAAASAVLPPSPHQPLHPIAPEPEPEPEPVPEPAALAGSQGDIAFSITELAEAASLEVADLRELQRFGIIEPMNDDQVPLFDADALMVARASAAFMSHGLEARHLKAWKVAAEREAGVLEQLTLPVAKQNSAGASRRALEMANDLVSMGSDLRYAMLRRALRKSLKFD